MAYICMWVNSQNKWRARGGERQGSARKISEHLATENCGVAAPIRPSLPEQQRWANTAGQGHTPRRVSLCCVGPTHGPFMCWRARAQARAHAASTKTCRPMDLRWRKDAAREGGKKKNQIPWILSSRRVTCSQLSRLSKQVFSPLPTHRRRWGRVSRRGGRGRTEVKRRRGSQKHWC